MFFILCTFFLFCAVYLIFFIVLCTEVKLFCGQVYIFKEGFLEKRNYFNIQEKFSKHYFEVNNSLPYKMTKRLLKAIDYPQADNINLDDDTTFRKVVVWLEMNKLRQAHPNVQNWLNNIRANDWDNIFHKYKDNLGCPVLGSRLEELHWLLGYAIQQETLKNKQVYIKHAVDKLKSSTVPSVVTENPLDKLDFRSKEFADGINELAKILNTITHPDPLVTLTAVRKVITKRMAPDRVEHPDNYILTGTPFPIQDADLGFDLKDPVLNKAAKILRMLFIQDLRELQTKANELIVACQSLTANPKTDTKLGKVGF